MFLKSVLCQECGGVLWVCDGLCLPKNGSVNQEKGKAKQVSPLMLMVSSTVVVISLWTDFYSSFPKAGREMVFIALLFELWLAI